jgi:hypothetical protein
MDDSERRKIITDFIGRHPGCKAEEAAYGTNDRISRVPFFNTLKELIEEGIIKDEASNRRDHKLYVDGDNPLVSVPRELQEFEEAFVNLLQKTKKKILERDFTEITKKLGISESNPSKWNKFEIAKYQDFEIENLGKSIQRSKKLTERLDNLTDRINKATDRINKATDKIEQGTLDRENVVQLASDILADTSSQRSLYIESISNLKERSTHMSFYTLSRGAVIVFYSMIDVILFRSTVVWPNMINDKETLHKLYGITYAKVADIQIQLSKFLKSTEIYPISNPVEFITHVKGSQENLSTYLPFYWGAGMQEEIERVIYCISNIAVEIKSYGYDLKINWPPSPLRLLEENLKRYDALLKRLNK